MANEEHLKILKQGVTAWNRWRREQIPETILYFSRLDLRGVDLSGANLRRVDLSWADLTKADLRQVNLREADLRYADLSEANLSWADLRKADLRWADLGGVDLSRANLNWANLTKAHLSRASLSRAKLNEADLSEAFLSGADLSEADLCKANLNWAFLSMTSLREANLCRADLTKADLSGAFLSGAKLSGAKLIGTNLTRCQLVQTDLREANLTGCRVFGISAWGLELSGAIQSNLIITPPNEPAITVDNLEVAQFIYLLLNNEKIRDVIDTITTKVVLILGRFTPERKVVLDAIRDELRKHDYLPVLFDFDKPATRDLTETVSTLAHLARFVIADITEPRSIPQELQAIVPDLAVPVQPLLLEGSTGEYGMFQDLRKYDWVLETYQYDSLEGLLASLGEKVIAPAEAKAKELAKR